MPVSPRGSPISPSLRLKVHILWHPAFSNRPKTALVEELMDKAEDNQFLIIPSYGVLVLQHFYGSSQHSVTPVPRGSDTPTQKNVHIKKFKLKNHFIHKKQMVYITYILTLYFFIIALLSKLAVSSINRPTSSVARP